jgi:hypothetical protein
MKKTKQIWNDCHGTQVTEQKFWMGLDGGISKKSIFKPVLEGGDGCTK